MDNSFDVYKKAIKTKYEDAKSGDYANFLLRPTDAKLRDLCILIYRENTNREDLNIFRNFFGFDFEAGCLNKIKNETGKFKPLQTFLNGKTALAEYNYDGADMIAVLVNYKNRPYRKFMDKEGIEEESPDPQKNTVQAKIPARQKTVSITGNRKYVKLYKPAIVLVCLVVAGILVDAFCFKKQCMQWQNDHYELVDCKLSMPGYEGINKVHGYDPNQFNMRKIKVTPKTVFFVNRQPMVWYHKQNNIIEYFNMPGFHPITNKPLKEITPGMIQNHVLNK
jgi:hypothetical protein